MENASHNRNYGISNANTTFNNIRNCERIRYILDRTRGEWENVIYKMLLKFLIIIILNKVYYVHQYMSVQVKNIYFTTED